MRRALLFLLFLFVCAVPSVLGQTTAQDHYDRGVDRQDAGDLDAAVVDYNRAIELNPKIKIEPLYAEVYTGRGMVRYYEENYEGSIADSAKAIEIDPLSSRAYYNRGLARYDKKDLDGAIAISARRSKAIQSL
jgi:tetratricopeptide (TPR) repeat protein